MRAWYLRTPLSHAEQQAINEEMALLGIHHPLEREQPIEFWEEHQGAVEWFMQVQDLMRYGYGAGVMVCEGLDVLAVQADANMSGREINQDDYVKLRLMGHTLAQLINAKSV